MCEHCPFDGGFCAQCGGTAGYDPDDPPPLHPRLALLVVLGLAVLAFFVAPILLIYGAFGKR